MRKTIIGQHGRRSSRSAAFALISEISLSTVKVSAWRDTLDKATEDVRKELGKLAVRAQTSLESVDEIGKELDQRRDALKPKE